MRRSLPIALVLLLSLFISTSFGSEVALFGANQYVRTRGAPNVYVGTFLGITGPGKILINNGDPDGKNRVDVASILVNGAQVIPPSAFELPAYIIQRPVNLARNNSISIELRGEPGKYLTITVTEEIVCTAIDQCHVAGTWDRTLGACTNPPAANGTTCNDGNACTQTDTCQAGVCVGSNPVVCTAADQCHIAGVCSPATGLCSNPPAANGTACNDFNVCTQTDTCQAGVCVGSNPVVCEATNQCHIAGVCNPVTGCSNPAKPDGTPCNDGLDCTEPDSCQAGICGGIDPRIVVDISPTLQRFVWVHPDGRVDLNYFDHSCGPYAGSYNQSSEPAGKDNYCGPTAGMNLLEWYGTPSSYDQLASEMHTNDWMSFSDVIESCLCFCSPCPWCVCPEPTCSIACSSLAHTLGEVGTHPDDMEDALRKHSLLGDSTGYVLFRHRGNPGLGALEYRLAQGNPIVVLIWTGSSLHWTLVTGTYDQNGTTMVRFANHDPQTWDWFLHQWSFEGLNWPAEDLYSNFGVKDYVWMHYEKTAILRSTDYGQGLWMGDSIISVDGRFRLILQEDSNLCLRYVENDEGIWCSMTNGTGAVVLWMQTNGNLVLRDSADQLVWSSNSYVGPGGSYYLAVQNDGNLVIYNAADNKSIWQTDTCCH